MEKEVYLDNSATTKCFPEAAELMNRIYLTDYGNPSSMHHKGVVAENYIRGAKQMKFLQSEGYEVTYLDVDENGRVDPAAVYDAVRDDTILVSVMHTNNEIGALEPVAQIGEAVKRKNPGTLFHVDAVQGFGKALIHPKKMHIDLLSASGHKIHSPKGVGLLYIGDGVKIQNIIYGGGQQNGMRSGTENVAGIAAMALSAKKLYDQLDEDRERLYSLKQFFIEKVTFEGVRAEVLLHALEEKGIYVSAGSACASNHPHISDTLLAIHTKEELLDSTLRFSTSVLTTKEELQYTADALQELIPFLRKYTRQ